MMSKPIPPWLAGFLRGVVGAGVVSGIGAAIVALGNVKTGSLAPFAPIAILALRQLEGFIDQKRGVKAAP